MRRLLSLGLAAGALVAPAPFAAQPPVVVIGAGLAGLTTAYRLQQAGLEPLVLEASDRVGGRARTASYPNGVHAEAGLQEYWDTNPAVGLARELGVPLTDAAPAYCSLILGKQLYPFLEDTDAQLIAKILGPDNAGFQTWDHRMIDLYHRSMQRPLPADVTALQAVSFGEWLEHDADLSPKAKQMVRTVEFATEADRISALEGVLEWHLYAGDGAKCYLAKAGNQALPEALAKRLGSHVKLGMAVTRIAQQPDGMDVTTRDGHTFHASRVVSTMPLFKLKDLAITPALPADVRRGIDTLRFGDYCSVQVRLAKAAEPLWHRAGQDVTPILTGGLLSMVSVASGSDEDVVNVVSKADGARRLNALNDDAARQVVLEELERLWPGVGSHVRGMAFVKYRPHAIASWPVGRSRLDALSDAVRRPIGRLYLAGDFTEGTHSDGASWSAVRVVRQICAAERRPVPALVPAGMTIPPQDR